MRRGCIGGAIVVAALCRLPMLTAPLSADEGGYLAIARGWAGGARLYRDLWVDRPQGVLLLYRFTDWLSGGSAWGVRALAIAAGAILIVCTAAAVGTLAGNRGAAIAAMLTAALTSCAALEGYAANGELLAGAATAAAIAVALVAHRRAASWPWWVAAGILAGCSVSLKQSGIDASIAIGGWLVVGLLAGATRRRSALRLTAFGAGLAIPLLAMVVHALVTGWQQWWWAVYGYRMQTQSLWSSADWPNLARTARVAVPVLAVAALAAAWWIASSCWRVVRRRGWAVGPSTVLVIWFGGAALAFLSGGGFWRHYWIQLGAPLAACAAVPLSRPRPRRARPLVAAALTAAVVPALILTTWVYAGPRSEWSYRAADDWRARGNEEVGAWFRSRHIAHPRLYAMCASAGMYASAAAIPGYPYLWFTEVHRGRNAGPLLAAYLADPDRGPEYVAVVQHTDACDPSGAAAKILEHSFRRAGTAGPVTILRRVPGSGGASPIVQP